jgi:hypothetical protein
MLEPVIIIGLFEGELREISRLEVIILLSSTGKHYLSVCREEMRSRKSENLIDNCFIFD